MRGETVQVKCRCGTMFTARVADRKRGWGKFCSKSCKAIEQEKRTGQNASYKNRADREDDGFDGAACFDNTSCQNSGD